MKRSYKISAGIVASLGLGMAVLAHAHEGKMGEGMGHGAMGAGMGHGNMMQGMSGGMGHGGMGHGAMGGGMGQGRMGGQMAGQQLMTPEEHTAFRDKMRNAATREERQKLAAANHAEMQKRAAEKGIALPEGRGPRADAGTEPHKH